MEVKNQHQLLSVISNILEQIIKETDALQIEQSTIFHAAKAPQISILNYFTRIAKYTHCSDPCFVLSLIYLDRLQERNSDLILNSNCIHRFIIVAMMIAIKYQDDDYYKNEYYAKVGGISLREINTLESEFLLMINYELFIEKDLFDVYMSKLTEYNEYEM